MGIQAGYFWVGVKWQFLGGELFSENKDDMMYCVKVMEVVVE